ncbi:rRNA-processing protein cgr1 [Kalmusia sp. IMI 367209]|nr:rRNA-processing protein cgr1 [Kalmusia sp. IMI 367209]
MGAALSKLWGTLSSSWTGKSDQQAKSVDYHVPATQTPISPPTAAMSGVKKYEITEPWLKLHCALGEAPFYEESTNTLRFVDIENCELHSVSLADPSSHKVVATHDISIGCTADIEGNDSEFIFGGKYGYGICNRTTGAYRWIKKVWSDEEVKAGKPDKFRGNDGAVDSGGRFWVGYMFDPLVTSLNSDGAVFKLHPDGSLERPLDNITIPNGTTWNKADDTMFFTDSIEKTIYQFDFDPETGKVSNRRPFFTMPEDKRYGENAVPDGHCIDEEGYMWTALHGGGRVLRISPEGEVVGEVKVPTSQPTCPCFCGEELVITSAGGNAGEGEKPVDEFAGSLFKVNVAVRGLKKFKFKGGAAVEGGKVDGKVVAE